MQIVKGQKIQGFDCQIEYFEFYLEENQELLKGIGRIRYLRKIILIVMWRMELGERDKGRGNIWKFFVVIRV